MALSLNTAEASHFRGGTLSYVVVGGATSRTVRFTVETYFSSSGGTGTFNFGDGKTYSMRPSYTTLPGGIRKYTISFTHTYARNGTYTASWGSCCWISGISNRGGGWTHSIKVVLDGKALGDPQLNSPTFFTTCTNAPFTTNVNATDPARLKLSYRLNTPPSGMVIDQTGQITWSRPRSGKHVFAVTVSNSSGVTTFREVLLTVSGTCSNRAPVITLSKTSATVKPGTKVCVDITGTDPDRNSLLFLVNSAVTGATAAPSGYKASGFKWTWCWTPAKKDEGTTWPILFTVADNGRPVLNAQKRFLITVTSGVPPTITLSPSGTSKSVNEGGTISFKATAADPDGNGIASFTVSSLPSFCSRTPSSSTSAYTITCKPNYTHGTKVYNITFTAVDKDGKPKTTKTAVLLTVRDVNRKPVFTSRPSGTAIEDKAYTYAAKATDPDGDKLTWTVLTKPSSASFNTTTGVMTWTPRDADAGKTFSFRIRVCDTKQACVEQSWSVKVTNTNDAPRITTRPGTTATEDKAYTYSPKVSDPDPGDSHTWRKTKGPAGVKVDPTNGKLTWVPGDASAGKSVVLEIEVCDKAKACGKQSWTVKVTNVNDAPVIVSKPPTTAEQDKAYAYSPKASDPDPGEVLTWKGIALPRGATIDPKTGRITWTPKNEDVGKATTFSIQVCDKAGKCASQKWTVTPKNVNDAPRFLGSVVIDDFNNGPVNLSTSSGNTLYSLFVGKGPIGGRRQIRLREAHSGTLGGKVFAKLDTATGLLSFWGSTAPDQRSVYGLSISEKGPSSATPHQGNNLRLPVLPTDELEVEVKNKAATLLVDFVAGSRVVTAVMSLKVGVNKLKLSTVKNFGVGGFFEGIRLRMRYNTKLEKDAVRLNYVQLNRPAPATLVYVGDTYSFNPTATDPDPKDVLSYKKTKGPAAASVDPKTGKVTWKPADGDSDKEFEIEVEVCDNGAPKKCAKKSWKVKVLKRCVVDNECPTTQLCVVGICKNPTCTSKAPCKNGSFCSNGKCVTNPCDSKACAPGSYCRPTDGKCIKSCAGVTCKTGEVCKEGACVKNPCGAVGCKKDEVCDTIKDPSKPTCRKDICKVGSCKDGRTCAPNGRCVDDTCSLIQCPDKKQRCVAGRCVERQPCVVDNQCPGDQVCVGKLCYPMGCYDKTAACKTGEQCIHGDCYKNPCVANDGKAKCNPTIEFCRQNDPKGTCAKSCANVRCKSGEKCVDGACVPNPCDQVTCKAGEVCLEGKCEAAACNASNVCKHGRVCNASKNRCEDDPCAGVKCPNAKEVCQAGQCVPPPKCKFDGDCPGDQLCVGGKCVQKDCSADSDCKSGELCVDGQCKKDPCDGVKCKDGEFCRNGKCVGSCAGVYCKDGEVCIDGNCTVDQCKGKKCAAGEVCKNGACVKDPCETAVCRDKRICNGERCVEPSCNAAKCPSGQTCKEGQCTGDRPCKLDKDCPSTSICVGDKCVAPGCHNDSCSTKGDLCSDGQCVNNPCGSRNCADGEYCRPSDGTCVKTCPTCGEGKVCRDGKCEDDPCKGVKCGDGEKCVDGTCEKDICLNAGDQPCKYTRKCMGGKCTNDPCLGVTCNEGDTCKGGICYGSKPKEEPVDEPGADAGPDEPSVVDQVKESKADATRQVDFVPIASGGCACASSNESPLPGTLLFFLFLACIGTFRAARRRR